MINESNALVSAMVSLSVVVLVVLGLVVWLAKRGLLPSSQEPNMSRAQLADRIASLERADAAKQSMIEMLQTKLVDDARLIDELRQKLVAADKRIAEAGKRIAYLEGQLTQLRNVAPVELDFPLLAIFGSDPTVTAAGEAALNQSNVPYRAIHSATTKLIAEELQRRRGPDFYRWLCVFTHARGEPPGIELADGIAGREFWNDQLVGLEGAFLMGCSDVRVADWVIGVTQWVVSMMEDVKAEQAKTFTCTFFSALRQEASARAAYRTACQAVPTIAKFTDFREAARRT